MHYGLKTQYIEALYTCIIIAALVTLERIWKQLKCLTKDEFIREYGTTTHWNTMQLLVNIKS